MSFWIIIVFIGGLTANFLVATLLLDDGRRQFNRCRHRKSRSLSRHLRDALADLTTPPISLIHSHSTKRRHTLPMLMFKRQIVDAAQW